MRQTELKNILGKKVIYIPNHAHCDIRHPDCETGVVTNANDLGCFVRYGNDQHSKLTNWRDLVLA